MFRWIYKEDKRRRNEFGQVGDDDGVVDDEELLSSDDDDFVKDKDAVDKKQVAKPEKLANIGTALESSPAGQVKKRKGKK